MRITLLSDNIVLEYFRKRRVLITVHVPLFREVFLRRMRQNPEGSKRGTVFYAVSVHREACFCEQREQ